VLDSNHAECSLVIASVKLQPQRTVVHDDFLSVVVTYKLLTFFVAKDDRH